tara:strand:+ start:2212 stop:3195 length:984 start_codon:yes stop_codon:yes gene_type:complete
MGGIGILLMNVGTPDNPTIDSVRDYLREFLLDPDVIDLPKPLRHLLVRGIILRFRPRKIAPRYESIWMEEGSPLRVYTSRISHALEDKLGNVACEVGMRYGNPSIKSGLEKLRDRGVTKILLAPLYPHYAQATTESSLKHAHKQLKEIGWSPQIAELPHFPNDPAFIEPLAESLKPLLTEDTHLVFSYHGLPMSHIRRAKKLGIPNYAEHCKETTASVVDYLEIDNFNWSLSFQSRLGPVKWLEPSTLKVVEKLAKGGRKRVVIVSPSFLADGLETLEELNIEVREHFLKHGGEELVVAKCLNDSPKWIEGLSILVTDSIKDFHQTD